MLKDCLISYTAIFQADANKADFLASKAISIIEEFKSALNGSNVNYRSLYNPLNYKNTLFSNRIFETAQINDKNLISYLKFKSFLNQLKIHKTETNKEIINFLNFLDKYQQQSLEPGLLKYKNNLLLIQDPESLKQRLGQLLLEINKLTQSEIIQHRQEKIKQELNKVDTNYFVTDILGQSLTEKAINTFSKHFSELSQNDEFKFTYQLQLLVNKKDLNYNDIAQLKISSEKFEKSVLKLKPINEITRFHWLINVLCNFLNFFTDYFESNKSLAIKHQFKFWHQCLTTSENNVALVENNILNIR